MSWRLPAWLIVSLALHAGLAGITYQLLREVLPDALFIDLTLVPLDEEPVAVARTERNGAAPLGPGPEARSARGKRAKTRHSAVQPSATPGETRRAPGAAAPDPAPAERAPAPAAPLVPPPVAPAPAPTVSPPAPAIPVPATVPPPANEPTVAAPAIAPGPPPAASHQAEARAPESSGGSEGRSASPDASPGERAEHGAAGSGGPGARPGDGAAAGGREGGALALAIPGAGRGAEGEYAALLRGRVVDAVRYPPTARRDGLTGTVEMDLFVDPTGTISRVVVVASSSHRVLDDAAVAAVRRVGRVPFPEYLHPRPLRIRLPVVFVLQ